MNQDEKIKQIQEEMKRRDIPFRRLGEYWCKENAQTEAVAAAMRMIMNKIKWLAFLGQTGTGKTHLACALIYEAMLSGMTVEYTKHIGLIREIRSTYGSGRITEKQVVQRFNRANLLVIDEIGLRSVMSDWERATLDDIIDHRSEMKKRLILTSNLSSKEFFGLLGERVESRFAELGEVVPLIGDDYRTSRGNQAATE